MNPGSILQASQLQSVLDDLSERLKDLPGESRARAESDLRAIRDSIDSRNPVEPEPVSPAGALQSVGEKYWIDALESMHDSFLAIDRDWNLAYINERYARLVGQPAESLIGGNFWELFPRYRGTLVEANYRKAMEERFAVNFQLPGLYSTSWYEISVYPTADGIAIFASDRTEQHRAEAALLDTEASLRESIAREQARAAELETIMNVVPAMIWVSHDRECKGMTGNPYGFEFLGMGQADNISKTAPEEVLQQQPYRNFKDGREIPTNELPMQVAAATGQGARDYEFDLVFNDGEVRTVLGNIEPLFAEDRQPAGAVAAFIDITARKQAEEQTRRQNAILSGINRIFEKAITCQTEEELGGVCLAVAEEVTQSKFGFVGEINPQTGKLDDIAISDPGWEACRLTNQAAGGKRTPIGFTIHGIYGRVLQDGKGFFTNDPASHPDHICAPPGHPPLTAFLGVPLIHAGKVIGMVGLGNRPGGYGPDELAAAEALAPAIVQALMNKRADEALQINQHMLELFVEHAPAAIAMFDKEMRYLAVSRRWLADYHLGSQNVIGRSHYEVFPEIDERWKEIHRRCLAGAVETREEDPFPRQDGTLDWVRWEIHPWYHQPGAVGGLMMFTEVITERRAAELKHRETLTQIEVQRRLLDYREQERQVIARELHDGPVQTLSSLIFNVQFLKDAISDPALRVELEPILLALKETVQDLRGMLNDLRPPSLIRFGLAKALQFYLEDFREKHPEVILDFTLMNDADRLSEQARLNLFRIVQEGLNNVIKHAGATRIGVHLERAGDRQFALEIQDNGAGFNLAGQLVDYAVEGHFGLAGMKERAEAIGGKLQIKSAPGEGTTIRVTLGT